MSPQPLPDPQPRGSLPRTLRLHYSETLLVFVSFTGLARLHDHSTKTLFHSDLLLFLVTLERAVQNLFLILRFCFYFLLFLGVKGL